MGRAPCCEKMGLGLKKGPWTPDEDNILVSHIQNNGHGNWRALPRLAGLLRCGKSCRLRWINYLRPDIKRGNFTKEEEETIIKLHEMLGNRWSAIAARLPGRTDNEIKNVWHTHLKKKLRNNPSNKHQRAPKFESTSPLAVSDLLTVTADGDVKYIEMKSEEMEPIQILPLIDDSFWSDDLDSFSVMCDNLLNDSSTYNYFSSPIEDLECTEPGNLNSNLLMTCLDGSSGQSEEENAEFWYDMLRSAGGVCV